jgi:phosphatidylserine/phosphatidylglycerophosphate/cardiolipin synthase-like enzyme
MKINFIFSLLILICLSAGVTDAKSITLNNAPAQVYFSPHGGCTEAVVDALNHAKSEVLVQAYSFTSKNIAKALLEAHKRGVHVEIILDKSNRSKKYSAGDFTAHMGIQTYIDSAHTIAHNKIMIIDKETVITGSFNFTKAAENNNAENLLIITSMDLAKHFIENWERHKAHSEPYMGR